jgi:hypothetical protein
MGPKSVRLGLSTDSFHPYSSDYLDVWLPTHNNDEAMVEKLISNNMKYYA